MRMQSSANTVEEYLAELPEERREVAGSIRRLILDHPPPGYSLYRTEVYRNEAQKQRIPDAYEEMGVKADMGKSCLRFTRIEKLPRETVAALIAETPVEQFIADYKAARGTAGRPKG